MSEVYHQEPDIVNIFRRDSDIQAISYGKDTLTTGPFAAIANQLCVERWLLIVDQFEELFGSKQGSDFFHRGLDHPPLSRSLKEAQFFVGPPIRLALKNRKSQRREIWRISEVIHYQQTKSQYSCVDSPGVIGRTSTRKNSGPSSKPRGTLCLAHRSRCKVWGKEFVEVILNEQNQ